MVEDYYNGAPAISGTNWPFISWFIQYFNRTALKLTAYAPAEPESTPDSVKNPSTINNEEEGLPSPPMDELPIFDTQTGPMELSQVHVLS